MTFYANNIFLPVKIVLIIFLFLENFTFLLHVFQLTICICILFRIHDSVLRRLH